MDLRQLRYFVTVAAERNFNRAARRLNMAQPPLSRAIQHLETEVGAQLIDRTAKPLVLTFAGQLLHEQAVQILRRVDDMRSMMQAAVATERRRFAIGFVASTIYARLPAIIRAFRSALTDVDLTLLEIVSLNQIAALRDGRIDVGFGRIRFDDPDVRRIVLREEPLVVALPASHPLARESGPIALAALAREPMILYPSSPRPSYADQVLRLLRDHGIDPNIAQEARELQIAVGLVAAEEGICIVPESVRKARVDDVCYRQLAEPATSPIIMSVRAGVVAPEVGTIMEIVARLYGEWGYPVPAGLMAART